VFFKYWAERHLLIMRSSKRFRLLAPFPGSRSQARFPHFTDREVALLWAHVRTLHPGFEHYTMEVLRSRTMVDLPFADMAASLRWTLPRCVCMCACVCTMCEWTVCACVHVCVVCVVCVSGLCVHVCMCVCMCVYSVCARVCTVWDCVDPAHV
jgi:hypothetical protein